ncbi:MAG: 2TM domain-containing protein [Pseudomonadota bacterium]
MPTPEAYQRANARARARLSLYKQAAISLALGLLLLGVNLATYRGHYWFWWPVLGLALLLGLKAVKVLGRARYENLEKRLIQEELDKEERLRDIVDD